MATVYISEETLECLNTSVTTSDPTQRANSDKTVVSARVGSGTWYEVPEQRGLYYKLFDNTVDAQNEQRRISIILANRAGYFSEDEETEGLRSIITEEVRKARVVRKEQRFEGNRNSDSETESEYDTEEEIYLTMDHCIHGDAKKPRDEEERIKRFAKFRETRRINAIREKEKIVIFCSVADENREILYKAIEIACFAKNRKNRVELKNRGYLDMSYESILRILWANSCKCSGTAKVTRDLTERKIAEEKVIAAYEESVKVKSEFLATMSHELRTPMNGALAAAALLAETPISDEQRSLTQLITESGTVLLRVINDILDLSKMEANQIQILPCPFSAVSIIDEVIRGYERRMANGVFLYLQISPTPPLPPSMFGDPLRFRQILCNLVDNAWKFTERGSITVTVAYVYGVSGPVRSEEGKKEPEEADGREESLRRPASNGRADRNAPYGRPQLTRLRTSSLTLGDAPPRAVPDEGQDPSQLGELSVTVSDTGIGINDDMIGRLFKPFSQGDLSTRKRYQGTGLGLSISRNLAILMGGDLSVKSVPGKGSTFRLQLPFPPVTLLSPEDNVSASDVNEKHRVVRSQSKILIAEDNDINQRVIRKILSHLGYENKTIVANGDRALWALRKADAEGEPFDVVLMDVQMPVMDGLECTAAIRADPALSRLPIIGMTANALEGDRMRCLECGMDDYASKPIDMKNLAKALERWLVLDHGGTPRRAES
ncbi:hypothetical protein HDU87_001714 [Geranomyces variabilis]|uniref:Uncharacterized protein n=1 Tax=Geranomyces variabilis TaxID=109894 RepID=A0AAD5TAZ2_9FUNG|nr:hypothetical protein HDU87_001714 [Geranomyces variabilis]